MSVVAKYSTRSPRRLRRQYLASDQLLLEQSVRGALAADDCKGAVTALIGLASVQGKADGSGLEISAIMHDTFASMKTQVFRRCVRGAEHLAGAVRRRRR